MRRYNIPNNPAPKLAKAQMIYLLLPTQQVAKQHDAFSPQQGSMR